MNAFRLDGQVAVLSGGGTGLGLAMARCLAEAGARVVLLGRRAKVLEEAAASIGERASFQVFDVTHTEQAGDLLRRVEREVGPVSILVNNAGVHLKKFAVQTTEEEFRRVIETHLMGSFALTRAAAVGMTDRGHGSILFITSMTALFGVPQVVAYSAAKSAMLGMVRTLATELSPRGVRVNAIAPGWIDSAMMRQAMQGDPARLERVLQRTPMQRLGDAEDIGHAAVYLCSPAAKFVTGIVLPVDGGISIGF